MAVPGAAFGEGTGLVHLSSLQCQGFEDSLLNCSYSSDTTACSHANDVSIICQCKWKHWLNNVEGYYFLVQMQLVVMERCDCVKVGLFLRGMWRSVATGSGVPCVMICGTRMTLEWYVDNWDTLYAVSSNFSSVNNPAKEAPKYHISKHVLQKTEHGWAHTYFSL